MVYTYLSSNNLKIIYSISLQVIYSADILDNKEELKVKFTGTQNDEVVEIMKGIGKIIGTVNI